MSDRLPHTIRYFNCIVIVPLGNKKVEGKKYRNIKNTSLHVSNFLAFAKQKFPDATHINFYDKINRSFVERIYLE